MALLFGGIVAALLRRQVRLRDVLAQARQMGVGSLPLVMLTAMLSGVVTAQQGGYQFTGSVPLYIIGSVVTSTIVLELGPIMTAFVVIGRVGARITAELGTMQVSEQIDAIYALGRDPVAVLAAPRLIAGVIAVPALVAIADTTGVFAGMLMAQAVLGLGREGFFYGASLYWHDWDLFYSLSKALAFGYIIPLIGVHMGLAARGGAEGVGRATTRSVVFMIIGVLTLDALFPSLLLN